MSQQPHDKDDLPGMLAVAKGIAEQTWPHTMDAAVWAAEFVKMYPGSEFSEGDMIGWFANAIMAGYDTANARRAVPECGALQEACDIGLAIAGHYHPHTPVDPWLAAHEKRLRELAAERARASQ